MIGEQIGEYQIVEVIAQGGMATVYKAYQPSFDRYVALKVLPSQVSEDSTFLRRFRHEARVIARLEHRSILPVYQYGEHNGMPYIAMRLIEAGSLRKKLFYEGQLDLPTTTRIVEQVAEGLDYAHSHGVVHRDLKPSNILLDEDNNAYLTDFGIAKLLGSSTQITGEGVVGTPTYMSPEQCRGKEITPASDIYALGVILYEMLTGRPPFEADTPLAVMYMHVKEPIPSVRQARPDLPPEIDRVVRRAMAKLPQERYSTASALAADLRRVSGMVAAVPPGGEEIVFVEGEVIPPPDYEDEEPPVGLPGVMPSPEPIRHSQPSFRSLTVLLVGILGLAAVLGIAGIGFVVLSWMRENPAGQAVMPPPSLTATSVEATQARSTSTPVIVVITGEATATATEIAGVLIEPSPLPSETQTASPTEAPTAIPTTAPPATSVPPSATAMPTATPSSAATPAIRPTATATPTAAGQGMLAFTQGSNEGAEIAVVGVDGQNLRLLTGNNVYDGEPDWSPDGRQIVFESRRDGNMDIYVMNADGSNLRRLTTAPQDDRHPDWSPDGRLIVYESGRDASSEIYVMNADGSGHVQLTVNGFGDRAPRFSPDGTQIAYMTEQRGNWEIAIMAYPTGALVNFFTCPAADCRFPAWSPNGKSIAYNTLDASGRVADIWVLDVASGQSTVLVRGSESGRPAWSGDGLSIFFNRTVDENTDLYHLDLPTGTITRLTYGPSNDFGPDWFGG